MPPKLTKSSKAVKALEKLFSRGQISGSEKPAKVYQMHDSFRSHNYRNFCDKYRKMREDLADPEVSFSILLCIMFPKTNIF